RRRHTRWPRDWSSDVCSSDLECARLLGPESSKVLQWFRRAALDGGFAAEIVTPEGQAKFNGGDAALSGLLAWTAWYAVHALGEKIGRASCRGGGVGEGVERCR